MKGPMGSEVGDTHLKPGGRIHPGWRNGQGLSANRGKLRSFTDLIRIYDITAVILNLV